MARWHLALFSIIGFVLLTRGSSESNPFQVMNQLMRRMKAEFKHVSSGTQNSRQFFKFKQTLRHIVRIRFMVKRKVPPGSDIVAKLENVMRSRPAEIERHMRALLRSVGAAFGQGKAQLLVEKIRDLCNRHIVHERKKIVLKLREKPKKKFAAFRGKWKESEAASECHRRGGHLAMIENADDHFDAVRSTGTEKMNFFINAIHPLGGRGMWLMPSLRPWFQRPKSIHCAMLDKKKHGAIMPVDCKTKQGALCEFLSFNPYIRYARVKRVFFSLPSVGTFAEGSRHCKHHGGKIATVQCREDLESAQRVNGNFPSFINIAPHMVHTTSNFCKSGNISTNNKSYRYALNKGVCHRVKKHERLTPLCEIRVLKDRLSRSISSTVIGKVFVAFNKKTDLYSKTEAASKCHSIGGTVARIRNNPQQLAAVEALHHGLPVRFDHLSGKTDKWFWWSDGTRLPKTQEWRIGRFNMNQGVSLNKFGEWNPAIGKMGVLCEVIRESGKEDNGFGFKTEIRMNVDFDRVTATAKREKVFIRALEAEVRTQCKAKGKRVKDVIVMSLRPGSTIAKMRVWTHSDGRAEASALQNSLNAGVFSIMFGGRKVSPTADQVLSIDFDATFCIFKVIVPTKLVYYIIPGAIAFFSLILIVAMVYLMRRKKLQARANSVSSVDKKKETMAAQEVDKVLLPTSDTPPPYPANEDILPDYDAVLKYQHTKV